MVVLHMNRLEFRDRLAKYKSAKLSNPDLKYWDFKALAFEPGGVVGEEDTELKSKKKYYLNTKYSPTILNQQNSKDGGYTSSRELRERIYQDHDPTTRFNVDALFVDNDRAIGEEAAYWATYNGLGNFIPKMNQNAYTPWDKLIEEEKLNQGQPVSDFFGTTPRMDYNILALADTTYLGKIYRNYDDYISNYKDLPDRETIGNAYNRAKKILENPNIYHEIDGDEYILRSNREIDEIGEYNPLGMLGTFGLMWDKNNKLLRMHDTYDFPNYARFWSTFGGARIQKRPREMKIRSIINFDPLKGSILLRDSTNYNSGYPDIYKSN